MDICHFLRYNTQSKNREERNLKKQIVTVIILSMIIISIIFMVMLMRNMGEELYETGTGTYVLNEFEGDLMLNAFRGRLLWREEQVMISSYEELNEHLYGDRNYPTAIISTHDEFVYLYSQLNESGRAIIPLEKYNLDFFENKSLVIVGIELPDTQSTIDGENATLSDNTVIIRYNHRRPLGGFSPTISWYTIIVEIPKNVSEIIVDSNR